MQPTPFQSTYAPFTLLLLLSTLWLSGCAGLTQQQVQALMNLQNTAAHTRIRVDQKLQENPESLLRDSLTVLDSILTYTENVKTDPERFNPEQLRSYQLKIAIINENIERFSDLKLQADVSFPLGGYQLASLSEYGRQASDLLVNKLSNALTELAKKYPSNKIRLIIKAVGYTDEIPISPGSALEKATLAEVEKPAKAAAARRAQLNQVLSRFRAQSLQNYVVQGVRQQLPAHLNALEIVSHIEGMGESLPRDANPQPPYQREDERRRVCIVSPFIVGLLNL